MRLLIDLDDSTLDKVDKLAEKEKRKRKQMIELLVTKGIT